MNEIRLNDEDLDFLLNLLGYAAIDDFDAGEIFAKIHTQVNGL